MQSLIVRSGSSITLQGSINSTGGISYMPLIGGNSSASGTVSSPVAVGSVYIDPDKLASFTKFDFEAILNVTGSLPGLTAYARLYDLTTASTVATISTTSTTQTFVKQADLSKPGSARVYEVRLYLNSNADASYRANISMARLRFS